VRRDGRFDAVGGEPVEHALLRLRLGAVAGDQALDRRVLAVVRVARIGDVADEAVQATRALQLKQGVHLRTGGSRSLVGRHRADESEEQQGDELARSFLRVWHVTGG
jgi:hypothetical protein